MSLATTLMLRDQAAAEGAVPVRALALYYGLFGLRDSTSRRLLGGPWDGLTPADLDYYLDCYLPTRPTRQPYVDCLSADLSYGVPPTYLAAAEFDRCATIRLRWPRCSPRTGWHCTHEVFPGVLHAFLHNSRLLDQAAAALHRGGDFLRRALEDNN